MSSAEPTPRRFIAGAFLLTFFSSFGQTFFVAGSAGEWMATFGLSSGEFGRLYMMATLASALSLPWVGRVVDLWSEPKVVAVTAPLLAGACLLAAYAPSVIILGGAIYLLRLLGQGMMTHIALTSVGRRFIQKRGRAVSLATLGHQGGEASLPLIYTFIAAGPGWQSAWTFGAATLIFIALPLSLWLFRGAQLETAAPKQEDQASSWTRGQVLRDPVFWVLLTGVLAPPFIGTTLFFHQDYLRSLRGWEPTLFASSFTAMAATTIVFVLIAGWLIDRFGAKAILPFYLLPLAAACLAAGLVTSHGGLYLFMVLLGVSYGFSSTLFGSLWPEVYGTEHLGAVRAAVIPFLVLATAIGPGLTGTLIDRGIDLPTQLLVMAGYCVVGAVLMTAAKRHLMRRILAPKTV